jgi:hypothetical protein
MIPFSANDPKYLQSCRCTLTFASNTQMGRDYHEEKKGKEKKDSSQASLNMYQLHHVFEDRPLIIQIRMFWKGAWESYKVIQGVRHQLTTQGFQRLQANFQRRPPFVSTLDSTSALHLHLSFDQSFLLRTNVLHQMHV